MKSYIVYEPPAGAGRTGAAADSLVFVRDGFAWLAFLFPPLWLLWRRAWLGLLVWFVGAIAIAVASLLGIGEIAEFALSVLLSLLFGWEGPWFQSLSLARRGYRSVGFAWGTSQSEAEAEFFAKWLSPERETEGSARHAAASDTFPVARRSASPALGVFPLPEGRR